MLSATGRSAIRACSCCNVPSTAPTKHTCPARPKRLCCRASTGNQDSAVNKGPFVAFGTIDLQGTGLISNDLRKLDELPDAAFYAEPRLVQHLGPGRLHALTDLYRKLLRPGWTLLDLCSSFDSHLPDNVEFKSITGHGLNAKELQANSRLDSWWVQDLNVDHKLRSIQDNYLDAVLCCAGVQYLQKPVEVLSKVRRSLTSGGLAVISFGDHCFPEKAIAAWLKLNMQGRSTLVQRYLQAAGFVAVKRLMVPVEPDAAGEQDGRDALCVVIGHRPGARQAAFVTQSEAQYQSFATAALAAMDIQPAGPVKPNASVLKQWVAAYQQLLQEATSMGIPASAVPQLPAQPNEQDVREARATLENIIASFLSSGL